LRHGTILCTEAEIFGAFLVLEWYLCFSLRCL